MALCFCPCKIDTTWFPNLNRNLDMWEQQPGDFGESITAVHSKTETKTPLHYILKKNNVWSWCNLAFYVLRGNRISTYLHLQTAHKHAQGLAAHQLQKKEWNSSKWGKKRGQMSPAPAPAIQAYQLKWGCVRIWSLSFTQMTSVVSLQRWKEHFGHRHTIKKNLKMQILSYVKLFSLFWHMCQKAGSLFKL